MRTYSEKDTPIFGDNAAKFILPLDDAKRIFKVAASAYVKEEASTRPYLGGVHLVLDGQRLRATSTDGCRLVMVWIEAPEDLLQHPGPLASDKGVIVPGEACKPLAGLVFPETRISETWVEARTRDQVLAFRLIDQTCHPFPKLDHVIPAASSNVAEVASAELLGVLKKLTGSVDSNHRRPIVKIEWLEEALRLTLAYHPHVAPEKITAKTSGSGLLGCNIKYLSSLITAVGPKRITLDATAEPWSLPIRIAAPNDANLLALLMPCRVQELPQ
jgi:DNA polymerase III sliding clamp (beta) subunit (PCNA family)